MSEQTEAAAPKSPYLENVRIRVAIPTYDNKIFSYTSTSLMLEMIQAAKRGWRLEVSYIPGSSLVHLARDRCAHEFRVLSERYASTGEDVPYTHLVFIDADVSWKPGSICQLIEHGVDFVGGAYRKKRQKEEYPVFFFPGETKLSDNGLAKAMVLPGGFLCLTHEVFDRLEAAHQDRKRYTIDVPDDHDDVYRQAIFPFWQCPFGGGEDETFCKEYSAAGGDCWLDVDLHLGHHAGAESYVGHFGHYTVNRMAEEAKLLETPASPLETSSAPAEGPSA